MVSSQFDNMLVPRQNFTNLIKCIRLPNKLFFKKKMHVFYRRHPDSMDLQGEAEICIFSKLPVAENQALDYRLGNSAFFQGVAKVRCNQTSPIHMW